MAKKLWLNNALECLRNSLQPLPHETNEIDWKAAVSDKKERLIEHLSAFSNEPNGGCLVFGIDNAGSAVGVNSVEVEQIANTLANLARDALEPPMALEHAVDDFEGVPILIVHIPEQGIKPVHRRGKSIEDSWIRSNGTTRKASRTEIAALLLYSKQARWEDLPASGELSLEAACDALELKTIERLLNRTIPTPLAERAQWLIDEGLITAASRGYVISNFGAIAAAIELGSFDTVSRKALRLIRYKGLNKVSTIEETMGKRGYAIGFEGLIAHLINKLSHSEVIEQSLRKTVSLYPEIALRELIANALIHQDFSITGAGPMVEIFDDRLEITNPGCLLPGKKVDRLIGTTPESRNDKLASSFRRYGICEERGTGFQKVISAIEIFGMPPLKLEVLENAFRVTLFAPSAYADMNQEARIEAAYQHAVLKHFSNAKLTNTSLRERFKLVERSRSQISNLIAEAVLAGRLKRVDQGDGTKFAEYSPYWA